MHMLLTFCLCLVMRGCEWIQRFATQRKDMTAEKWSAEETRSEICEELGRQAVGYMEERTTRRQGSEPMPPLRLASCAHFSSFLLSVRVSMRIVCTELLQ